MKQPARYKFFPAEVRDSLPALGRGGDDPLVQCKFFTPDSGWTWYATEYSDGEFFGYVVGLDAELGYWMLDDLVEATGPHGLHIERDIWWTPRPLSEVVAMEERRVSE